MLKELKNKKKQEGFTIIEVMIVLAIVGLIMLIVFLAVPALQRNSRNTQRKSEAAAIASAYSEFVNNRGGRAPAATPADKTALLSNVKFNFYKDTDVQDIVVLPATFAAGAIPAAPSDAQVRIFANAKCDATKDYETTGYTGQVSYSPRGGVVVFTPEATGTGVTTCLSAG